MSALTGKPPQRAATNANPISGSYLMGPAADFLLLGGGSLIVLAVLFFLWPKGSDTASVATAMMLLANFINHPHFANSYQLFYRDFRHRAFGDRFPVGLRRKYLFAALAVPLLLIAFFTYGVTTRNPDLLGWGANLMFFLVGWHYVKQGYGMLMVDAILKKSFFDEKSKRILLLNAYAAWITSWLLVNRTFSQTEYWGLSYYSFSVPDWLFHSSLTITATTTLLFGVVIAKKINSKASSLIPVNGFVAYAVSLYIWLFTRHPALLLVIPAFHSLQYLAVVWRYRINMERSRSNHPSTFLKRFALFLILGFILGYLGFWFVPEWLNENVSYDRSIFGGSLFLFLFWISINVHHYFLDTVMWRKDNPDTKNYLFNLS